MGGKILQPGLLYGFFSDPENFTGPDPFQHRGYALSPGFFLHDSKNLEVFKDPGQAPGTGISFLDPV